MVKPETKWETFKKNLYGYSLIMWDGMGFFGTNYMKLGRLRGEKVDFCTKFKSIKDIIIYTLTFAFAMYFVLTEIDKLGELKSQRIDFNVNENYEFEYDNAL